MSLQTRLTALAQAVGADIKDLRTKVTAAQLYVQGGGGATLTGNGTIPMGAITKMSPVAPFQRNADGTLTCLVSGFYDLTVSILNLNGIAGGTQLQYSLVVAGSAYGTVMASPTWAHGTLTAGIWVDAGQVVYAGVTGVGTTAQQCAVQWYSAVISGGPKGDKGDKGDPGYALMAAIGGPVYVNAAAGWNQLPFDAAAAMSTTDGTADFTRNASGSITFNKAGTYDISATMGNASAAQPTTATMDCRLIIGPVGVVNPDTSVNALTVERRQAVAGDYTICSLSGQVTVVAGQSLAAWMFTAVAVNGVGVSHFGITRQGGPQGPKGDPGGINVLTTLDWNTATTSNFYKSTNDFMQKTLHGPGDTLNPPNQAGIVTAHDSGEVTQRVWDLDYGVAYTRYRRSDNTWTSWAADLAKPPVLTGLIVGAPTPVDGDERFFQTAAMKALGIMWRFRYNAGSTSTYKWEFVGGSPYRLATSGGIAGYTTGNGAYVYGAAMATPKFTLPLSGDYNIEFKMNCQGGAVGDLRAAAFCNNVIVPDIESFGFVGSGAINDNFSGDSMLLNAVGGQVVDLRMLASVANAATNVYTRSITITPIRLTM